VYALAELFVVFACGLAAAVYHVGHNLGAVDYMRAYFTPLVALPLVFVLIAKSWQLYEFQALCKVSSTLGRVIGSLLIAFAVLIVLGFALGIAHDYSRLWLGLWLVSATGAVVVMRIVASGLLIRAARAGLIRRRTVVFGSSGPVARVLAEAGRTTPEIQIVGTFSDRGGHPWNDHNDTGVHLNELIAFGPPRARKPIPGWRTAAGNSPNSEHRQYSCNTHRRTPPERTARPQGAGISASAAESIPDSMLSPSVVTAMIHATAIKTRSIAYSTRS
jgi:hypothetical protein